MAKITRESVSNASQNNTAETTLLTKQAQPIYFPKVLRAS